MREIFHQFQWLTPYLVWMGWISAFLFVVSLALVPLLLARIPADYFKPSNKTGNKTPRIHYSLVWTLRNTLALTLILAGVLMLVLPGQGLLTIFLGLFTAEFPGKKNLEKKLISIPSVHTSINWVREKQGVRPLLLP